MHMEHIEPQNDIQGQLWPNFTLDNGKNTCPLISE